MPVEAIAALERAALGAFVPDLTLIFDVPVEVGRERLADGRALDKFEREQGEFFTRVRETYLRRARAESRRMRVIDSTRSPAEVRSDLSAIVESLIKEAVK